MSWLGVWVCRKFLFHLYVWWLHLRVYIILLLFDSMATKMSQAISPLRYFSFVLFRVFNALATSTTYNTVNASTNPRIVWFCTFFSGSKIKFVSLWLLIFLFRWCPLLDPFSAISPDSFKTYKSFSKEGWVRRVEYKEMWKNTSP